MAYVREFNGRELWGLEKSAPTSVCVKCVCVYTDVHVVLIIVYCCCGVNSVMVASVIPKVIGQQ